MKTRHILSLSLLPISLLLLSCEQDTPTTISTTTVSNPSFSNSSEIENEDEFIMTDFFSGSGASGDGEAELEDGELELELDIKGLIAGHPYEVHVIVGPEGNPDLDLDNLTDVHVFSVTADEKGELDFEVEFDLGLDPGQYRLDYVVVHDHVTVDFPGNLVVACDPASFFTITDKSDKSDKSEKSEKSKN